MLAAGMAVSGKINRREKVRVLGAAADVLPPLLSYAYQSNSRSTRCVGRIESVGSTSTTGPL
jgi:hypothetical protein